VLPEEASLLKEENSRVKLFIIKKDYASEIINVASERIDHYIVMKRQEYGRNVFGIRKYSKLQTGLLHSSKIKKFFYGKAI